MSSYIIVKLCMHTTLVCIVCIRTRVCMYVHTAGGSTRMQSKVCIFRHALQYAYYELAVGIPTAVVWIAINCSFLLLKR